MKDENLWFAVELMMFARRAPDSTFSDEILFCPAAEGISFDLFIIAFSGSSLAVPESFIVCRRQMCELSCFHKKLFA